MSACWIITGNLSSLLGQLNAVERLRAVRRLSSGTTENTWLWGLMIVVGVAIVAIAVGATIAYKWKRPKRNWADFYRRAERTGLSDEETNLLVRIARASSLKNRQRVFTSEAAFNRGLLTMVSRGHSAAKRVRAGNDICNSCTFLISLKEKLNFEVGPEQAKPTLVKLGRIDPGTRLSVFRRQGPDNFDVTVAGMADDLSEITVSLEAAVEVHPGETWVLRYPQGGIVWEFNTWVVSNTRNRVVLRTTGDVRWVNRRRFVRIRTTKPAYVARFPFHKAGQEMETPEFVPAILNEIGVPGLKFEAPLDVQKGERVLVILELQRGGVFEGTGITRRTTTDESGTTTIAVELIGLTTSEVAALVRETNVVAQRSRVVEPELARQGSA